MVGRPVSLMELSAEPARICSFIATRIKKKKRAAVSPAAAAAAPPAPPRALFAQLARKMFRKSSTAPARRHEGFS
jgi:hypothetical protein